MSRAFRRDDASVDSSVATTHTEDESEFFKDLRHEASKKRVHKADVNADDYFGKLDAIDLTGLDNSAN